VVVFRWDYYAAEFLAVATVKKDVVFNKKSGTGGPEFLKVGVLFQFESGRGGFG
jgi:hypothetical protein